MFRQRLGHGFKAEGFTRSRATTLGWQRGPLLVWFQCNPGGWDPHVGSHVWVNFQIGGEKSWDGPVRRLHELLTDDDLELLRSAQNRVIAKLSLPPRSHVDAMRRVFAHSADADLIIESYLAQFRPDETPYVRHQDRPLRYWDADDLEAWSDFLLPRLPRLAAEAIRE